MGVGGSDGKVVNLSHEKDPFTVDCTQIETWFVDSWCESDFPEDFVSMFLPESWGFKVALHSRENRYDVTWGNGGKTFVFDPPIIERAIRSNKEALFWGWGFGKCVRDVSAKDE